MAKRLYIGNLPDRITEDEVKTLFLDNNININLETENILLKQGYAFVDCEDQSAVDSAIEKLSGLSLHDKVITVEPAVSKNHRNSVKVSSSSKLAIKSVSKELTDVEVKEELSKHGTVKDFSRQNESVHVTYANADEAQGAKEKLNGLELKGQKLKADFLNGRKSSSKYSQNNSYKIEFPLRLLVPRQYVGAIMGRAGQTIRTIARQSNARVDVVRRDNTLQADNMVVILGAQTENCTLACLEILKVINSESVNDSLGAESEQSTREPELRILAHNNLCGRLIGKQGVIIKGIMEGTETTITVSSVNNIGPINFDRVVSIRGTLEAMCLAAEKIHDKLKLCFESDMQNPKYNHPSMFAPPMSMPYLPWSTRPLGSYMPSVLGRPGAAPPSLLPPAPQQSVGGHMTCFMYIPKASVGAVIGTKGTYINYVKQESRASCQVLEDHDHPEAEERPVKITGYPSSVTRAQWFIFEKIKNEGFTSDHYSHLRCDVLVPKNMVGRIIGKGGRNVRHIQDIAGVSIKLPGAQSPDVEDIPVQITGNFQYQILAQDMIRQLLTQGQLGPPITDHLSRPMSHPRYFTGNNRGSGRHVPLHESE